MPSKRLVSTRSQLKRKALELQTNAPVKKARVDRMKELAAMFEKGKKSNNNNSNYFNTFYVENKLIYPWLTKESLRWHIRVKKQVNIDTTNQEECNNKNITLESVSTDHNHEVRSHDL